MTTVGMVAGEASGDLLASKVLRGLQAHNPGLACAGIGGSHMQAAGFNSWHSMDALSVFGYVDALKTLPRLARIYTDVKKRWLQTPPDVFVGIDAPDFNLRLEAQLKAAGTPTVHFVSPSIWAWRYQRIHKIRNAVSHMLVLFPFEEALYQKEGIAVTYVGHPLAQLIPQTPDQKGARRRLGIEASARVVALMPGSRGSEIRLLAQRFIAAAVQLQAQDRDLQLVIPLVNAAHRDEVAALVASSSLQHVHFLMPEDAERAGEPASWIALAACDAVLLASGTATLEAALFKRPMVISYVISPWMRRMMAWQSGQKAPLLPWVGLPNILANDFIVPELLQEQAHPDNLAQAMWTALTDEDYRATLVQRYHALHEALARDTADIAARVILHEAGRGSK